MIGATPFWPKTISKRSGVKRLCAYCDTMLRAARLAVLPMRRAIAAPQATANAATATAAAPALQVVDTASGRTADAIVRLNENLEAGIRASVSITGEDGFERQWNRYNKMKNRK